jgi:hypoxanthine phosphoribosyltransferase
MKWNVYISDINRQKIVVYNIFEHGSFIHYVKEAIINCKDKESFTEQLKRELRYYFWSKSEWEIIISPWLALSNSDRKKIDVFDQVMLNWDIFVDYVWDNREELMTEYEEKR